MYSEFHRIKRLPPYVFAEVNAMKAAARAAGEDVIDFGMGNPDLPTPDHIVQKMIEATQDPSTHRYSMSKGIPGLRKALCGYYERRFNVTLDPESEVVVTRMRSDSNKKLKEMRTLDGRARARAARLTTSC